ncbi:MAG: YhbY family RNA-binding protein [Verrucomicrobia bacterium]|nr:YhbY family RNA-binding protein [Verrucomicrobiota bacterium]
MQPPLSTAQIAGLRSQAQRLDAILKVGKQALAPGFIASVKEALERHELIKVKFADHKDEKKTLAPQLAEQTGSILVTLIGNVAVLFRRHPDPARRRIQIKPAVSD